jgi:hypothetical protein
MEEACRTKKYELFGEEVDVSHIVIAVCESYLERVKNFFVSKLRDGSTVGAVLFVGGGTALIQSILGLAAFASIYKGKRFIAKGQNMQTLAACGSSACTFWMRQSVQSRPRPQRKALQPSPRVPAQSNLYKRTR